MTYYIKNREYLLVAETPAYILFKPVTQTQESDWRNFLIELSSLDYRCHFPLAWNGVRLADGRKLKDLRKADPNAEKWIINFLTKNPGILSQNKKEQEICDHLSILWAERKKALLSDAEQACHSFLSKKLNINHYRILWHTPLSQFINTENGKGVDKSQIATLLLINKDYDATVEAAVVPSNFDKTALACLRNLIPVVYQSDITDSQSWQHLLTLVAKAGQRSKEKTIINEPEFRTKQHFEESLKRHMLNPYFDNTRSRMEIVMRLTDAGKLYSLANDLELSDITDARTKMRIGEFKREQIDLMNESRNPLAGFYFLHEFSMAAMIKDPPGIAGKYDALSDNLHLRLRNLAVSKIAANHEEGFENWRKGQDQEFVKRGIEIEKERIFQDSVKKSKHFNDYFRKSPVDLMILDPKGEPVVAVEFDGQLHQKKKQQDKDRLKEMALFQLDIPLIRISSDFPIRPTDLYRSKKKNRASGKRIQETKEFVSYIFDYFLTSRIRKNELESFKLYVDENLDSLVLDERNRQPQKMDREFESKLYKLDNHELLTSQKQVHSFLSRDNSSQEEFEELIRTGQEVLFEYNIKVHSPELIIEEVGERNREKSTWLREQLKSKSLDFELKFEVDNKRRSNYCTGWVVLYEKGAPLEFQDQAFPSVAVPRVGGSWLMFIPSSSQFISEFLVSRLLSQIYEWLKNSER
ncbi:DUF2726 domain-containing protein [Thiohalocapsa marina]|uniref:DUF2726 domain-containing protein n=1 Tax=Thiohalocapsa marina TaxID=424902 RepID=A0A5M8FK43_9GAMM|nr:DUF2726 domain-containing protein [Thiohalocapsa marina]KAA6185283.1 DUF2726 domain-containing protein [Thiohalocapsa marina]